jgi:HlyD family secretion protein
MKRVLQWSVIVVLFGVVCGGLLTAAAAWVKERRRVTYREAEVTRGRVVAVVNSTGTVKPVRSVSVGAFVSGPIKEIYVDFNAEVKKGDLLAIIDPQIYKASVLRDEASLEMREAELKRAVAQLAQATNDELRLKKVREQNKQFVSDAELDVVVYNKDVMAAQLKVAQANIVQAQGSLDMSKANLDYTEIRSPVDGIVLDRKIDPGQTVASTYQTPELFVVAPDLKAEMHVFATVDETDIGLIREAQLTNQPVLFTVDAYPDDLFTGKIYQIRKSSTTTQNVVTYPVVVSTPNPDLKLLPGMTASLSFQLREANNVLRLPNAALRFFPQREQVRPEDRPLLEAKNTAPSENEGPRSAEEKAKLRAKRNTRLVWVVDGDFLRAVEIVIGLSDNTNTEVLSGALKEHDKVVTGIQPRE